MSEQKLRELRDQLVADINRPEGRWGMHGHSCVDDDYFQALYYVVGRIDEALAQPAAPVPEDLFKSIVSPTILAHIDKADELLVRRIWDDVRRAMLAASQPEVKS